MALSLTMSRNNSLWIMDLPLELHFRIRSLLLADPDTTLDQLRPLRLVCKNFDSIYAPVVLSHMMLFPSKLSYPALLTYLRSLVHGLQSDVSPQSLHPFSSYCTTLIIKDWRFAATPIDRRSSRISPYRDRRTIFLDIRRKFWNRGITTAGFFALIILGALIFLVISVVHLSVGAAVYFSIVIAIFMILWAISYRKSFSMESIRRSIKSVVYVPQARHYIALLPKRLELPNVRCVRLFIDSRESDWSIYYSTRLLLSLPQLTELELAISPNTDLTYLTKCLAHMNKLRKISLQRTGKISLSHTASLGTALIAQNEHLTQFEYDWRPEVPYDLSLLFRDVPILKPRRLLHVSLNATCTNFEALVPHTQVLTSFQFHYGKNTWCNAFLRANVFPSTIKVERVDAGLILLIREHPGIVNLSISTDMTLPQLEEIPLFNVLCRHVRSLHHLCLNTKLLARMLSNVEFEMDFLRCTANLRELILLNGETISYHANTNTPNATYANNEQRIFPVIARLNRSLTVVIASQYKEIFSWSLAFCWKSTNPLIRDLARRLVYEKGSS